MEQQVNELQLGAKQHDPACSWRFGKLPGSKSAGSPSLIRYATFSKPQQPIAEYLIFFNGRNEFIEKYLSLPTDLELAPSCAFLTWDHRGQGASSGQRCHIDSYETFARDAQQIIDHQVSFMTPYAMLAHSMGALIALYGIMKQYFKPRQLIITSPLLGVPNHPLPRIVSKPLASFAHHLGCGQTYLNQDRYPRESFACNPLTHDEIKYQYLQHSPYEGRSITFGWLRATFQALEFIFSKKALSQLDVPLYILTAGQEDVTDPQGAEKFSTQAKQFTKRPLVWEQLAGAKHELLFEDERYYHQALARITSWLKGHSEK